MNRIDHVFIPCKMASKRIPRKNLQTIGGRTLLETTLDRFQTWYPSCIIWVATEDDEAAAIAKDRGCIIYPLTDADVNDQRKVSDLYQTWLNDRWPSERCCLTHCTTPFFFRSELQTAVDDPRPFVCGTWTGKLYLQPASGETFPMTQAMSDYTMVSGCFYVTHGRHHITADEWTGRSSVPVSWLGLIDIDEPADLRLADVIATPTLIENSSRNSHSKQNLQFDDPKEDDDPLGAFLW